MELRNREYTDSQRPGQPAPPPSQQQQAQQAQQQTQQQTAQQQPTPQPTATPRPMITPRQTTPLALLESAPTATPTPRPTPPQPQQPPQQQTQQTVQQPPRPQQPPSRRGPGFSTPDARDPAEGQYFESRPVVPRGHRHPAGAVQKDDFGRHRLPLVLLRETGHEPPQCGNFAGQLCRPAGRSNRAVAGAGKHLQ